MPWAGIPYVREAVRDSTDIDFLCQVASKRAMFDGTDEEAEWKEVVNLVFHRIAQIVEEAAASPEFGSLSMEMLERVVGYIADGEWSEETVYDRPCRSKDGKMTQSDLNSHGFNMLSRDSDARLLFLGVMCKDADKPYALALSSSLLVVADIHIRAGLSGCESLDFFAPNIPFNATKKSVYRVDKLSCDEKERCFTQDNSCKISFRTRASKIQKQCLALVWYYEKTSGNVPSVPASNQQHWALLDAWRYYSKAGFENLASILRDYICIIFHEVKTCAPKFFRAFTCSELDSVLAQDNLYTNDEEVHVLKVALDWARQRSSDAGSLKVGDEVRVKQQCIKYEAWRGADCVVKKLLPSGRTVLVEQRIGRQSSLQIQKARICCEDVHDAAATGMLRLLARVRHAFVPLLELRKELSNADMLFASKHKCFGEMVHSMTKIEMVKSTAKVQAGKTKQHARSQGTMVRWELVQTGTRTLDSVPKTNIVASSRSSKQASMYRPPDAISLQPDAQGSLEGPHDKKIR